MQESLFPRHHPSVKGLEYSARCRPARSVSGDYYDFIPLDRGKLGLLLADVCGKGMGAALLGASLHGALRANSEVCTTKARVLLPRTIAVDLFGYEVRCLDLDALIHTKRAAGRARDLEAIAELEILRMERDAG